MKIKHIFILLSLLLNFVIFQGEDVQAEPIYALVRKNNSSIKIVRIDSSNPDKFIEEHAFPRDVTGVVGISFDSDGTLFVLSSFRASIGFTTRVLYSVSNLDNFSLTQLGEASFTTFNEFRFYNKFIVEPSQIRATFNLRSSNTLSKTTGLDTADDIVRLNYVSGDTNQNKDAFVDCLALNRNSNLVIGYDIENKSLFRYGTEGSLSSLDSGDLTTLGSLTFARIEECGLSVSESSGRIFFTSSGGSKRTMLHGISLTPSITSSNIGNFKKRIDVLDIATPPIDNQIPVVTTSMPVSLSVRRGSRVTLTGTVSENIDVDQVNVLRTRPSGRRERVKLVSRNRSWTYSFRAPRGTSIVTVTAKDVSGNVSEALPFTVTGS